MTDSSYVEQLRRALRESSGDSELDMLTRVSIFNLVSDSELGREIFEEETGPEQAMLELHLSEGSVHENAGPANEVAAFISRISVAAGAIAKQRSGRHKYKNRILLEGVAPGSLHITLKSPTDEPKEPGSDAPFSDVIVSNAESEALRTIASVLHAAEINAKNPELSNLSAIVSTLPVRARAKLRSATKIAEKQRWLIDGTVTQRHQPKERFGLGPQAAGQLIAALEMEERKPEFRTIDGILDGFKYTLSTMYFKEVGSNRSYAVAVPHEALMLEVAHLASERDRPVRAKIAFFHGSDEQGNVVQGRLLKRIEPLDIPNVNRTAYQEEILEDDS